MSTTQTTNVLHIFPEAPPLREESLEDILGGSPFELSSFGAEHPPTAAVKTQSRTRSMKEQISSLHSLLDTIPADGLAKLLACYETSTIGVVSKVTDCPAGRSLLKKVDEELFCRSLSVPLRSGTELTDTPIPEEEVFVDPQKFNKADAQDEETRRASASTRADSWWHISDTGRFSQTERTASVRSIPSIPPQDALIAEPLSTVSAARRQRHRDDSISFAALTLLSMWLVCVLAAWALTTQTLRDYFAVAITQLIYALQKYKAVTIKHLVDFVQQIKNLLTDSSAIKHLVDFVQQIKATIRQKPEQAAAMVPQRNVSEIRDSIVLGTIFVSAVSLVVQNFL